MSEFKQYRRKQIAELREVTQLDINDYDFYGILKGEDSAISVTAEDLANGSPKIGDMIARNPKNHRDQWLVAKQYFEDNFEEL